MHDFRKSLGGEENSAVIPEPSTGEYRDRGHEKNKQNKDKQNKNSHPSRTDDAYSFVALLFSHNCWSLRRCKLKSTDFNLLDFQLRHHPPPRQEQFDTLRRCAGAKGFNIDTKTNKDLANSLDKCVDPNDQSINKVPMTQYAEYHCLFCVATQQVVSQN